MTGLLSIADPGISSIAGKTAAAIASATIPAIKAGKNSAKNAADAATNTPTKGLDSLPINPETGRRVSRTENPLKPGEFGTLPEKGTIDPKRIRPSQSDMANDFKRNKGNHTMAKTIREMANGHPDSMPPVRIYEMDGKTYTLDHRRLVAARIAEVDIKYQKATPKEIAREATPGDQTKFTTLNDGMSIDIRGTE